ncbi:UvrD-helicase domain-containing protein [Candidatus Enterovibrio altilux]|uniref:UvrD-helicase domain-containing protein n=1 Tax=Candidatus Enterovibrio altilux TaxID=1927128 RepID=UPI000BBCCC38
MEKLGDILNIEACHISTFHSIENFIYNKVHDRPHSISKHCGDEKLYIKIIDDIINDLLLKDPTFQTPFLHAYNSTYYPEPEINEIRSSDEYKRYIEKQNLRTLKGYLIKSYGELTIANFLYLKGVDYEYEPDYSKITGANIEFKYTPDFYIKSKHIFLEHFGINRNQNTHPGVNKEAYNHNIQQKRNIHETQGSVLIKNFHYEDQKGNLTSNLEQKLIENEVVFEDIDKSKIFDNINLLEKRTALGKEFVNAISKIRSNDVAREKVLELLQREYREHEALSITKTIWTILEVYKTALRERDLYTFDDMIIKGLKYVSDLKFSPSWKYILVDKFQDISPKRAELIQNLRDQAHESSLFCVGDDWQAINHFAGSDLAYTVHFDSLIRSCSIITLDKTFRFDNNLCDLASKFITQNPLQYKKTFQLSR